MRRSDLPAMRRAGGARSHEHQILHGEHPPARPPSKPISPKPIKLSHALSAALDSPQARSRTAAMPETLLSPRNLAFELYEVLDAKPSPSARALPSTAAKRSMPR